MCLCDGSSDGPADAGAPAKGFLVMFWKPGGSWVAVLPASEKKYTPEYADGSSDG